MVEIISVALGAVSIILIPAVILLIRIAVRWKGIEDRLNVVVDDLGGIVKDKDAIHQAILEQMREDRKATDRRLRWLEEHIWNRGNGHSSQQLSAVRARGSAGNWPPL